MIEGFSISGEEDQWLILSRTSKRDMPLVVRSRENQAVRDHAEAVGLVGVSYIVDRSRLVDNGMFSNEVASKLYDIEDSLLDRIDNLNLPLFEIAVISGEGRRVICFAAESSDQLTDCVEYVGVSDSIKFEILTRTEAHSIFPVLIPTDAEVQLNGDESVIKALSKQGDDGSVPRKVEFWFYGARENMMALRSELLELGCSFERWLEDDSGLVMAKEMRADYQSFAALTPQLISIASKFDVTYDGWETVVVQSLSGNSNSSSIFRRLLKKIH
ncbi:ribonuclease E inhibitor RraB [Parasphingorhabdus cellanae]|uniref:Ribonuclease E inhibitor RraB n=1 Tax=Parasphingorhabdus cellanae TaxID=2806553 RepID=A0ABX7T3L9_9SPHN|nr:ribonuclease E inhibitor RraB [Parasphingorhabdus cellanae]QTD56170.1 ribonuclease E inhibitor RraB [Parasphingorhabdus cellanae]